MLPDTALLRLHRS